MIDRPPSLAAVARMGIAAALLLAATASAQSIYRQIGEDGHVTFTDRPEAGAQIFVRYPYSRSATDDGRLNMTSNDTSQRREVADALARNRPISSLHSARIDAIEAARAQRARQEKHARIR